MAWYQVRSKLLSELMPTYHKIMQTWSWLCPRRCWVISGVNIRLKLETKWMKSIWLLIISNTFALIKRYFQNGRRDLAKTLFTLRFSTRLSIQNGSHFTEDIFTCIFLNEKVWIVIEMLLKFVSKDQIYNKSSPVQVMAWRRIGDRPLPKPMMTQFSRPRWVKVLSATPVQSPGRSVPGPLCVQSPDNRGPKGHSASDHRPIGKPRWLHCACWQQIIPEVGWFKE